MDIGAASDESITIESILHEKKKFDLSLSFEKLGMGDKDQGWTVKAPIQPMVVSTLPNRSNILSVAVFELVLPSCTGLQPYLAVTTADRQLHLLDARTSELTLVRSYNHFQDSPSLDVIAIDSRYLLIASMSGKLILFDTSSGITVDERKDHDKYVVKLAVWSNGTSTMVASAGWDARVFVYQMEFSGEFPRLGAPRATLALPSIPETIAFLTSPEAEVPLLLVARRDSTFLYYYSISTAEHTELKLLGKQNLAPHSNAWVAFTPSDIQICPNDAHLAAVATSSTPHMKLLIVKLMLPPMFSSVLHSDVDPQVLAPATQASQARAELVISDREEKAILVNVSTLAPQTSCT